MTPAEQTEKSDCGKPTVRREFVILSLVFAVGLGMRLADLWGQWRDNPFCTTPLMDEAVHHDWAQKIASGAGMGPLPHFRAPLYYYLLGGLYALCGPNIILARVLGCILGAATCALIARLGIVLGGRIVGLLAGLLAAFYWPLVNFDGQLLTVGLEVFFAALLLLLLTRAVQRGGWWRFLVAGVVWGLAAITRPNVLACAPALLIWIWIGTPLAGRTVRKLPAMGLLMLGVVLAILPVTIRNRVVGGEWVLIATNGGVNFYIGNNPLADGEAAVVPGTRRDWQGGYEDTHHIPEYELGRKLTEGQVSQYWFRKGLDWMRADPGTWLRLTWHKLLLFCSPLEIPNNQPTWFFARLSLVSGLYWIGFPVVGTLGLAGLALVGSMRRGWALVLIYGLTYMASVVVFFCADRYRLPFVPVLILLSAQGLARLPELVRNRSFARLAAFAAVAVAAALFIGTNPPPREVSERAAEGTAHFNLGVYYARRASQHPDEVAYAVAHFEECVRLRPYHAMARLWLGLCLLDMQHPQEAEAQFAAAVESAGDDPGVLMFYAMILRSRGELMQAAEQYARAIALQPAQLEAYVQLADVLVSLGRYQTAANCYREVLRRDPENEAAARGLAGVLEKAGAQSQPTP